MKQNIEQEVEKTMQSLAQKTAALVPSDLYERTIKKAEHPPETDITTVMKWAAVGLLVLGNIIGIYSYKNHTIDQTMSNETKDFIDEYALADSDFIDYLNQ
jgi:preprotein translocase subunit Sss1